MSLVRIAGLALGLWIVVAGAKPAEACGSWVMDDKEKGYRIKFLINSAAITKGTKRRGAFYMTEKGGLRVVQGRKVVLAAEDGKLRKRGKVVGTYDDEGLTLGKRRFEIILDNPGTIYDQPSWSLTVKRGDDVIVEGKDVWAMCLGHPDAPKVPGDLKAEIRRRVIYYLAWRELGL